MDAKGRRINRYTLVIALALVAVGAAFLSMPGAIGVSTDQMSRAEFACISWFNEDRDLGGRAPFSSDVWEKDGHIVVKVGFNKRGSSYSTRLCVYDPDSNSMSAPNNFTRSRWE